MSMMSNPNPNPIGRGGGGGGGGGGGSATILGTLVAGDNEPAAVELPAITLPVGSLIECTAPGVLRVRGPVTIRGDLRVKTLFWEDA